LGRSVCLRLSSIPLSSSSASQDQAIRLQDHTYCTSLAKTSMASRTSASVLCQASKTSFSKLFIAIKLELSLSKIYFY
jgi:hypothetical protein